MEREAPTVSGAPQPERGLHRSMLTKEDYLRLRAALSFERDYRIVALVVVAHQLLFAGCLVLLRSGSTAGYVLAQPLLAVVFFQAFSILHDCGHGSCLRRSWSNALLGHFVSLFCFLPYYPWKYHHALHHTWTGNLENDPTLKALRKFRETRTVPPLLRLAWRSWLPLLAAVQHIVFWSYPLRAYRHGQRWQFVHCLFSVLCLGASYWGLHALWPELFNLTNFGPAIVIYFAAVELVNMPHHSDRPTVDRKLPLWEQAYATRSCYYPIFVSEFLVLNFNFHIEHHLFPSLPWYRLRQARTLVKAALEGGYEEARGIGWNLRERSRDIRAVLATDRPPAPDSRE
ncbi:MAG TPA: fatty acid desaturase [Polyangiales bacterium]|nr:fatty acid desaturase [Polyangiales bacterium]